MIRITRTHRLLGDFGHETVAAPQNHPLVEIETLTWDGLPAARIKQTVERKHLIALVRLGAWVTLLSHDRARIIGTAFDTDVDAVEILATFASEIHRQEFLIAVQDDLADGNSA